jgi:hypothetical protein
MLYFIDPKSGAELAEPFAAPYADGKPMKLGPVCARNDKTILTFVGGAVVKLAVDKEKGARLREVARVEAGKKQITEMVLVGTMVVAAADRELLLIDPDAPKFASNLSLADAVDGDLAVVGAAVLARTRNGKLICSEPLGGKLEQRWAVDGPAALLGPAARLGETVWFATPEGRLQEFQLKDGAAARRWDARRSLAGGPWVVGDQLVVEAADGGLMLANPAGQ